MKRLLMWILIVGLLVGALVLGWSFPTGNSSPVDVDLIWIRVSDVALWWVILVSAGVGAFASLLVVGFAWIRGRLLNFRYRREIRRLEAELHEMRSLPLSGSDAALLEESTHSVAAGRA